MNQQGHPHKDHHHNPEHVDKRSPIQKHGKWFVLAVLLMIVAMVVYVYTNDESDLPAGDGPGQVVPAAP